MLGQEPVVSDLRRLRLEFGLDDAEHVLEMLIDLQLPQHRVGVLRRAVCQNKFATGQLFDRGAERRIGRQRRMIDGVDIFEIIVRIEAVLGHQAAHRRAVAQVIVLLHQERLVMRDLEEFGDIIANAVVDLLPQHVMRVERVVEIEHPGVDMAEPARLALQNHGSLNRTTVAGWPPTSMAAKPVALRPRTTQSF